MLLDEDDTRCDRAYLIIPLYLLLSAARPRPLEPTKFSGGNTLFYSGADTVTIEGPSTESSGVRLVGFATCGGLGVESLDPL